MTTFINWLKMHRPEIAGAAVLGDSGADSAPGDANQQITFAELTNLLGDTLTVAGTALCCIWSRICCGLWCCSRPR